MMLPDFFSEPFIIATACGLLLLLLIATLWGWRVTRTLGLVLLGIGCQVLLNRLGQSGLLPARIACGLMGLVPFAVLDAVICLNRERTHIAAHCVLVTLGLIASIASWLFGASLELRELFVDALFWVNFAVFIIAAMLPELARDRDWESVQQDRIEQADLAHRKALEHFTSRSPLADPLASPVGQCCTSLFLNALLATAVLGYWGIPRLSFLWLPFLLVFLIMASQTWLGLNIGWHSETWYAEPPYQTPKAVGLLFFTERTPLEGRLGLSSCATASKGIFVLTLLIRGLFFLPVWSAYGMGMLCMGLEELCGLVGLEESVREIPVVVGGSFLGCFVAYPMGLCTGLVLLALCGNPFPVREARRSSWGRTFAPDSPKLTHPCKERKVSVVKRSPSANPRQHPLKHPKPPEKQP